MVFKKGHIVTEETRRKISQNIERALKISLSNTGKHLSEETKQKLRSFHLGKKHSTQQIQKLKDNAKINPNYGMKGKHFSQESKRKMGIARLKALREGRAKVWNKGIKTGNLRKTPQSEISKKIVATRMKGDKYFCSLETKKKMSAKRRGIPLEKWDKFTHYEPYGIEFNVPLKNQIRKRDNQICMNCGIHGESLNEALTVHHINYDKQCNLIQNLISLCRRCHGFTTLNRDYWKKLFQEKLLKLYGYEYIKSNIILDLYPNSSLAADGGSTPIFLTL